MDPRQGTWKCRSWSSAPTLLQMISLGRQVRHTASRKLVGQTWTSRPICHTSCQRALLVFGTLPRLQASCQSVSAQTSLAWLDQNLRDLHDHGCRSRHSLAWYLDGLYHFCEPPRWQVEARRDTTSHGLLSSDNLAASLLHFACPHLDNSRSPCKGTRMSGMRSEASWQTCDRSFSRSLFQWWRSAWAHCKYAFSYVSSRRTFQCPSLVHLGAQPDRLQRRHPSQANLSSWSLAWRHWKFSEWAV